MKNIFIFTTQLRDIRDLNFSSNIFKYIPNSLKSLLLFIYPKKYKVIKLIENKKSIGYLLVLLVDSTKILNNQDFFKKLLLKILRKLKTKLGFSLIGLGSFTSVMSKGGIDYIGKISQVYFTNGNALTAFITFEQLSEIIKYFNYKINLGIVGANGSIGSALVALSANSNKYNNIFCIIKNNRNVLDSYNLNDVIISSNIKDLESCDVILMCTSSKSVKLHDINFKSNVIIYDITQPSNVKIKDNNIKIISGGMVELPDDMMLNVDMGYGRKIIYGCLCETLLLSMNNYNSKDFSLGNVDLEKIEFIGNLFNKSDFKLPKIKL